MSTPICLNSVSKLINGHHENPFELLGPHEVTIDDQRALAVRAFAPHSAQAWVIDERPACGEKAAQRIEAKRRPMRRIHPAGLFEAICLPNEAGQSPSYRLQFADERGNQVTMHDPYAFPPLLTDYDRHLLNEGTHWTSYERLGAHLRTVNGVTGVNFAVWAPNAEAVSVIGDFNEWDGRRHPMSKHIPSGFWELFIPEIGEGTLYKYAVKHCGNVVEKSDPYGFAAEVPPRTASKVVDLSAPPVARRPVDDRSRSYERTRPTSVVLRGPSRQLAQAGR